MTIAGPIGELLITGPALFERAQPSSAGLSSYAFAIPAETRLLGFEAHAQGVVLSSTTSQLTNALRLVVGQ